MTKSDIDALGGARGRTLRRLLLVGGAILVLAAIGVMLLVRHASSEFDRTLADEERKHTQDVVLSQKVTVLGSASSRFATGQSLQVKGETGELCFVLARNVPLGNVSDQFNRLMSDAQLKAVLHSKDGEDYSWTGGGWEAPSGTAPGRGDVLSCLWLSCNGGDPPKGTEIASIDVTSDRPLRILGVTWYSSDAFDGARGSGSSERRLACSAGTARSK